MNRAISKIIKREFGDNEIIIGQKKNNVCISGHCKAGKWKEHFEKLKEVFKK